MIQLTDDNFGETVLKSDQPFIVHCSASWASPSKQLAPILDELALAYVGRAKLGVLDVDGEPITPKRYGVKGIPTLLIFDDGQMRDQILGPVTREKIEAALNKYL